MKPLLNKVSHPLLIYISVVLSLSIPIYYFTIEKIWTKELDQHNRFVADKTKHLFNAFADKQGNLDVLISYWNQMQLDEFVQEIPNNKKIQDSIYTSDAQQAYITRKSTDNFRVLITSFTIHNKNYYFRKATSFESTRKTIIEITIVSFLCFGTILIGILVLQHRLSIAIWKPFNTLLASIKKFNLNNHQEISFPKTNIIEFEELGKAIQILTQTNISVYTAQKEFTENASHELQTPLAIIKNKMDLLLQDKNLTDNQYKILEDMGKALTRSSRINKNLLLLAKIDNQQFNNTETVKFEEILKNSIELLEESFDQKHIHLHFDQLEPVNIKANIILVEVLINNILTNAIRHTFANGNIHIIVEKKYWEVSNSGTTPLNTETIFNRFERATKTNNGSGLGLAIVKEICLLHKWEINYSFSNGMHRFRIIFNP